MSAHRDFNLKCRELIRGDLNKQYAALCSPSVPVSSFLFGDDLNKEVEDLAKANRLGNKVTPKQRVGIIPVPAWACLLRNRAWFKSFGSWQAMQLEGTWSFLVARRACLGSIQTVRAIKTNSNSNYKEISS